MTTLFKKRHSGRYYDEKRDDISDDMLVKIMEAGRWAPSSFGEEPWRFIFCIKKKDPEAWDKALSCLVSVNQEWAKKAPIFVLIIANEIFTKNQKHNRWAQYDTGAAAISMSLEAANLGLMTHQMGGFDPDLLRQLFHVPIGHMPISVMALGYEDFNLADKQNLRQRRPYDEIFFKGIWGRRLD